MKQPQGCVMQFLDINPQPSYYVLKTLTCFIRLQKVKYAAC